jgi:hypothetical protein
MTQQKSSKLPDSEQPVAKRNSGKLFARENRGLLLDLVVFVGNLFLLRLVTGVVIDIFKHFSDEEPMAKLLLGLIFAAMWILPALGAVLNRWRFHQRLQAQGKTVAAPDTNLAGCLFNPLFYFCLNLVITSAVLTSLGDFLFGKALLQNGGIFVPFIVAGLILTIIQTYLIYQYFSPPKKPPKARFLREPQSELLGDVCLFINMILFQVFWNMLTFAGLGHPASVLEFGGRLFFLCFIALLIYFPPRMFYLAEDIHRPRTWITMLLANSPVIIRVLIGTSSGEPSSW